MRTDIFSPLMSKWFAWFRADPETIDRKPTGDAVEAAGSREHPAKLSEEPTAEEVLRREKDLRGRGRDD